MGEDLSVGLEAARLHEALRASAVPRAVHLASGEARARFVADAAPGLAVIAMPPWDCLPYDWASPSPSAQGRRAAALRLMAEAARGDGPVLVLTSPGGLLQRVAGVHERRNWGSEQGFDGAAIEAGKRALAEAGVRADQIGLIINTSVTRKHLEPSVAVRLHHGLGLP